VSPLSPTALPDHLIAIGGSIDHSGRTGFFQYRADASIKVFYGSYRKRIISGIDLQTWQKK